MDWSTWSTSTLMEQLLQLKNLPLIRLLTTPFSVRPVTFQSVKISFSFTTTSKSHISKPMKPSSTTWVNSTQVLKQNRPTIELNILQKKSSLSFQSSHHKPSVSAVQFQPQPMEQQLILKQNPLTKPKLPPLSSLISMEKSVNAMPVVCYVKPVENVKSAELVSH